MINLGNKTISKMNIYANTLFSPCIYTLVEGGNEVYLIQLNDNRGYSFTNYTNILQIELIGYVTGGIADMLYYR